jgi:hypothetical protein
MTLFTFQHEQNFMQPNRACHNIILRLLGILSKVTRHKMSKMKKNNMVASNTKDAC